MIGKSRILLNPTTKEVEIEGTDKFVREYFDIVCNLMFEYQKPAPKTPNMELKAARSKKAAQRMKKPSNKDKVLNLIKGSREGITMTELEKKTSLADKQILGDYLSG